MDGCPPTFSELKRERTTLNFGVGHSRSPDGADAEVLFKGRPQQISERAEARGAEVDAELITFWGT